MLISLPKATKQVKSRAKIQSKLYLIPKYFHFCKNNILLKYLCPEERIKKTVRNHA